MATTLVKEENEALYTAEELASVKGPYFPEHVAVIMDGNRRWAKKRGLPMVAGHWRGAENLAHIAQAAGELGIKVLTVFAFSTENWKRSPLEIRALMKIFKAYLVRERAVMVAEGIRLNVIGDIRKFPEDIQKSLNETIESTKEGENLELVVALNYGGRDEICRAVHQIVDDCFAKKINPESISEETIASYLDTAKWKDPDLLIRPSGESRLSNFLLWQIAYSEVILTKTYWPDFNEHDLLSAVVEYQQRELRLGK